MACRGAACLNTTSSENTWYCRIVETNRSLSISKQLCVCEFDLLLEISSDKDIKQVMIKVGIASTMKVGDYFFNFMTSLSECNTRSIIFLISIFLVW